MQFSLEQILAAWQEFFHHDTPATSIAVFRIVWGLLLTANAILMIPDACRFFGPAGLLSWNRYVATYGKSRFTMFHLLPESNFSVLLVVVLHLASAISLAVGWYTVTSTVVAFLTLVSLHHRNPAVFHSGDSLMRLLTFLLIFSRAGECYSLDSWIAVNAAPRTSPWCERLMQIQICILYLRTVHWKLRGKLWPQGLAAYYPTQVENFTRLKLPRLMCNLPCIRLATWGTLLAETAIALLVWVEGFRYPVLLAGVLLHLIFELFLNLQLFGAVMITSYLIFVDPRDMQRIVNAIWRVLVA